MIQSFVQGRVRTVVFVGKQTMNSVGVYLNVRRFEMNIEFSGGVKVELKLRIYLMSRLAIE